MEVNLTIQETQALKNLIRDSFYNSINDESLFTADSSNKYPLLMKIFIKLSKAEDDWLESEKMAYTE